MLVTESENSDLASNLDQFNPETVSFVFVMYTTDITLISKKTKSIKFPF